MLSEPLQDIVKRDEGLYGIDEVIALSIVNVYGSIGFTNFGYIDKLKPGILEYLNDKSTGKVHTFLDDIVGGIAAAASSRLAHRAEHSEYNMKDRQCHTDGLSYSMSINSLPRLKNGPLLKTYVFI